nr:homeodomain-like protein [Tanacetum cinerariifolium]
MITGSHYFDYMRNPIDELEDEETNDVLPTNFLIGLDIPIVWIYHILQNLENDLGNMKNENLVSLVPGRALESWNELERESFLLGLYIFGKNFARLRRFIESKKVGDILSYYYGIFYKSDEYERWSDCRKSRGKKCILGPRNT